MSLKEVTRQSPHNIPEEEKKRVSNSLSGESVSKYPITVRNNRDMRYTELPLLLPEPDMLTKGSSYLTGRRGESQESCANVGKI